MPQIGNGGTARFKELCSVFTGKGTDRLQVLFLSTQLMPSLSYLLVILTNQSGIQLKPTIKINTKRLTEFKRKATAVFTQLDLPITIYAATTQDQYRKPRTRMWEQVLEDHDLATNDIDFENSIFIGDAGGRQTNGKILKDFSCSDRNFAYNVGIVFKTPEEYF